MTGQTIRDYTFETVLGQGGMAVVYRATDKKFHTDVAIKVLKKEFVYNENIRGRFLTEARNMFRMSHPHIIKVTDLIEEDDMVAFVMEYVEGQTLKDYLGEKKNLSNPEIKRLFFQLIDAVSYVHERGLVHRDIKPSNFMITKKGTVKLLDFGIAKNNAAVEDYTGTSTTQSMGTPSYMSPEQVKSSKEVQPQSDIYSLGVVLWEMVTGKKPYDSNTLSVFEIQAKIVSEPLARTGTGWDNIIMKATQKERGGRYPDAPSFQKAVAAMPDHEDATQIIPLTGQTTYTRTGPAQPVPKRNTMKYVPWIIIVLLAGVLLYFLLRDPSPRGEADEKTAERTAEKVSPPGLYPFTSERYITRKDLEALSPDELSTMRNEIYARYGYIFTKEKARSYFQSQAWYTPRNTNVNDSFSSIEKANIQLIHDYEESLKWDR